MTNNVNFTGNTYYSPYDIQNLAKYATGVAITNKSVINGSDLVNAGVGNLAIEGLSWLKDNKGNYKGAIQAQAQTARQMTNLYKTQDSFTKGVTAVANASQSSQLLSLIPDAEKLSSYSSSTKALYEEAKIAAETLGQTGTSYASSTANQLLCKANAAAATEAASNATGFWGKIKNALGINKASAAINTAAAKSSVGSACLNEFKAQGGGVMLALEGATEVVTNVYPTFKQLGVKSGLKQLGKSTVKTVASVGGWVAGAALGTKIGAAIGSIIPGAGTAVGAVVGAAIGSLCSLLGGTIGSKLAKSGAEKIVGKDELVLAQEKQAETLAQQAQVDSSVLNQVTTAAAERLNSEGITDEDSEIAYNSLNAISSGSSISTQSQTQATQYRSETAQRVAAGTTSSTTSTSTNPFATTTFPANAELLAKYQVQYS